MGKFLNWLGRIAFLSIIIQNVMSGQPDWLLIITLIVALFILYIIYFVTEVADNN